MEATKLQLDLFTDFPDQPYSNPEMGQTLHFQINKETTIDTVSIITEKDEFILPFEVGDSVSIQMPTEEQDSELHIWLQAYYPHLRGKIGKVTEVLPYKKQQYWIEFDVKHEDNRIIMYHDYLKFVD